MATCEESSTVISNSKRTWSRGSLGVQGGRRDGNHSRIKEGMHDFKGDGLAGLKIGNHSSARIGKS